MRDWTNKPRFVVLTALAALCAASAFGDDVEALNRSLYVPVELSLCEHLNDAVLYRGDAPIARLPGTHVFQFTFYPALKRLEPQLDRVRVEGTHEGEPFRMQIIVTPSSVYVGNKKIDLDTEKMMNHLRRTIDVRHEKVKLTLRCEHNCERSNVSRRRHAESMGRFALLTASTTWQAARRVSSSSAEPRRSLVTARLSPSSREPPRAHSSISRALRLSFHKYPEGRSRTFR